MKVKELIAELLCYDGELEVEVCDPDLWVRPIKSVSEEDYLEITFASGQPRRGKYLELMTED